MTKNIMKHIMKHAMNIKKTYISNAPEASVIVTLATRYHSLRHKGIDALIIDGDLDGVTVNKLAGKMGVRASTVGEIIFDNFHVPVVNQMVGDGVGFRQTMEVLNASRISIAAQCVGIAQAALEASVEYAKNRKAFGGTLSDLQAIQWMVVDNSSQVLDSKSWVPWVVTLPALHFLKWLKQEY